MRVPRLILGNHIREITVMREKVIAFTIHARLRRPGLA
jgi:hypothetical protein